MPKAITLTSTLRLALLATALPLAAHAQSGIGYITSPNAGSGGIGVASNATALSGSAAIARGGAATASNGPVTAAGGAGGAGGASRASGGTSYGSTVTVEGAGGYGTSYRVPYEAPGVAPATIVNNSPCSGGGVAAGASFPVGSTSLSIGNMDRSCQAMRVHGDDVAMETLCVESDDYRLARKHVAMLGRGEPCYDDRREVTAYLSRAETVAHVQTAAAIVPAAPVKPAYCGAYGRGAVAPKECM